MDWNETQNSLSNIVFAILTITMICYWINLFFFDKDNFLSNFAKVSSLLANGILFFILCSRWIVAGYFPLSNLYESLLFLTWILLALHSFIELKTKSKLIGAVLIPVTLLINGFANLTLSPEMQKSSPLVPSLQSNWLMLHVSMMLLSYATLIIGSLLCILFLVIFQYSAIDPRFEKFEKEIDLLLTDIDLNIDVSGMIYYYVMYYLDKFRLFRILKLNTIRNKMFKIKNTLKDRLLYPKREELKFMVKIKLLEVLDNWSYRIIGLGFPFLTIGIISGGVWANEAWGSYWSWDPKETWALITWLVFASYLHARITKGWQGKKTAFLGGLGFFVIWICYLGVNFLGKGLHSYGWVS